MNPRTSQSVLSLVVVASVVFAAAARAEKPVVFPFANSGTVVWNGACSFPVTVDLNTSGTVTIFVDESGIPRRVHGHATEQDTFSANGKTLTGTPYTFNIDVIGDGSGNPINLFNEGVLGKVRLPDGSLFIAAGRIDFGAQGFPTFSFTPDAGGIVNLDGLCAALAP
jgi:hypothetical protein